MLKYQNNCKSCGTEFIPFCEETRNCPKCGKPAPKEKILPMFRIIYFVRHYFDKPPIRPKNTLELWVLIVIPIILAASQALDKPITREKILRISNTLIKSALKQAHFPKNKQSKKYLTLFIRSVLEEYYLGQQLN